VPPDPEGLPPDPEVLPLDPAIKVIYGLWQAVVVMVVVMVYGGGHGGDVGPNCVPLCPQSPKTAVLVIQAMELHRTLRPSRSCVADICNKEKKTEKKGRRVGPLPTAPCRSAPSSLATNPRLRIFDRRLMILETMEETMLGRHDILLTSDAANTPVTACTMPGLLPHDSVR